MTEPWYVNPQGIRKYWTDNADGSVTITRVQETESVLENNKRQATFNDGYTQTREMRRVASIPLILIQKWKEEEGWDAFNPDHAHKLAEKLNSSEYMWLRTAEGHLGKLQDGGFR